MIGESGNRRGSAAGGVRQQFPGVFIDDIVVSTGEGTTSFEDDGDQVDGWTVPGASPDPQGIERPNLLR